MGLASASRWRRTARLAVALAVGLSTLVVVGAQRSAVASPSPTWTQLSPATSAPARRFASMAFDPATGQLVLLGGFDAGLLGDTWVWTGATWVQQFPATSPPARADASMAFDPATGQLVL